MSSQPSRQRAPQGRAQNAATIRDPEEPQELLCSCCDPQNPLVLRPDLGVLADGAPEFAICVLHDPEPTIYRNSGDGRYQLCPDLALTPAGEIVDSSGNVVGSAAGDYQRLSTIDDDDDPPSDSGPDAGPSGARASQPRTVHVDLSEDDFYWRRW